MKNPNKLLFKNKNKKGGEELKDKVDVQALADNLIRQLKNQKKLVRIPKSRDVFKGRIEENAVLLLSDMHIGKINTFLDFETGKEEETYNTEIMTEETNRLVDGIFTINQLLSKSYDIKKLYIFCLGDLLDNEIIVKGQQLFVNVGVGGQLVLALKVLSDLVIEMLKMFEEVELTIIGGNHGRMTESGKGMKPYYNNFDWILGQMLALNFKGEERVKVETPESWYCLKKIYDWKYFLHHGDTVYSWMSIPYYGIVRQSRARRIEMNFDIECIGHFHQRQEILVGSNALTIVNGGWIPKDDYAWKKFGTISRPEQTYFGVSPKRARSWSFIIDLLHSQNELKELGGKK